MFLDAEIYVAKSSKIRNSDIHEIQVVTISESKLEKATLNGQVTRREALVITSVHDDQGIDEGLVFPPLLPSMAISPGYMNDTTMETTMMNIRRVVF